MPKGGMFVAGAMSVMVAAGRPSIMTLLVGSATIFEGASPKLHCSIPPVTTD
jgi:hypothetical protein